MRSPKTVAASLAVLTLAMAAPTSAADSPRYSQTASIPGPDGFWDIASWDPAAHVVLIAHSNDVLVVDPAAGTARAIGAVVRGHSALPIPGTGEVLATSGGDNSVRILDRISGNELARIPVGANPDAAVVTPDGSHAYEMNAPERQVAEIGPQSDQGTRPPRDEAGPRVRRPAEPHRARREQRGRKRNRAGQPRHRQGRRDDRPSRLHRPDRARLCPRTPPRDQRLRQR